MEKFLFIMIILAGSCLKSLSAVSQTDTNQYLPAAYAKAEQLADSLLTCHLPTQADRAEITWLKEVFAFAKESVFEEYSLYTTTGELLDNGNFNCVSGTAFFAVLLRQAGYDVTPFEMQHHVYLSVVSASGKKYIIESTDRETGVFRQKKNTSYYLYDKQFGTWQQPVTLQQLAGLEWYNLAIAAYNHQKFGQAIRYCHLAQAYYPESQRVKLLEANARYCANLHNNNNLATIAGRKAAGEVVAER